MGINESKYFENDSNYVNVEGLPLEGDGFINSTKYECPYFDNIVEVRKVPIKFIQTIVSNLTGRPVRSVTCQGIKKDVGWCDNNLKVWMNIYDLYEFVSTTRIKQKYKDAGIWELRDILFLRVDNALDNNRLQLSKYARKFINRETAFWYYEDSVSRDTIIDVLVNDKMLRPALYQYLPNE